MELLCGQDALTGLNESKRKPRTRAIDQTQLHCKYPIKIYHHTEQIVYILFTYFVYLLFDLLCFNCQRHILTNSIP